MKKDDEEEAPEAGGRSVENPASSVDFTRLAHGSRVGGFTMFTSAAEGLKAAPTQPVDRPAKSDPPFPAVQGVSVLETGGAKPRGRPPKDKAKRDVARYVPTPEPQPQTPVSLTPPPTPTSPFSAWAQGMQRPGAALQGPGSPRRESFTAQAAQALRAQARQGLTPTLRPVTPAVAVSPLLALDLVQPPAKLPDPPDAKRTLAHRRAKLKEHREAERGATLALGGRPKKTVALTCRINALLTPGELTALHAFIDSGQMPLSISAAATGGPRSGKMTVSQVVGMLVRHFLNAEGFPPVD